MIPIIIIDTVSLYENTLSQPTLQYKIVELDSV